MSQRSSKPQVTPFGFVRRVGANSVVSDISEARESRGSPGARWGSGAERHSAIFTDDPRVAVQAHNRQVVLALTTGDTKSHAKAGR